MRRLLLLWCAGVMSLITFFLYGADKRRARQAAWRIPERTLLLLGVLGGAAGGLIGMQVFHHKTRRRYFWAINGLSLLAQAWLIWSFAA